MRDYIILNATSNICHFFAGVPCDLVVVYGSDIAWNTKTDF